MKKNRMALLAACGIMDLSWFYAWATFVTLSVLQRPFPFPEAAGSFILACLLTYFSYGRGWRVIYIALLQLLFFVPLLLRVVRIFRSWSPAIARQQWLTDSFSHAIDAQDWFMFMLIMVWIVLFWGGGIRLARRQPDYLTVCARFDRGLMAFFVLFLAKFLILSKTEIKMDVHLLEYLLFSFFLCSLLAIGLVRNSATSVERNFLPGYRGIGVILGFTVVLLLFCAGLAFFCLPYLTAAAETTYVLAKEAARPVGTLLMVILRFIFGSDDDWKTKIPEKQAGQLPKLDSTTRYAWWVELIGKFLVWVAWILLATVFLLIIGASLYFFVRWLLSKTDAATDQETPVRPLPRWAERLRALFRVCRQRFLAALQGYHGVRQLFGALQAWGRRSGAPKIPSETPAEYGSRLMARFPTLAGEFTKIVETFHDEVYGGLPTDEGRLSIIRSSWTKLRSPRHWVRRLKAWFFRRPKEEEP